MHDYGSLLAGALRERGEKVDERWVEDDGRVAGASLRAGLALVRAVRDLTAEDTVLWHYSSMAMGYRGIPGPGILHGLAARRRRARVVTVLHEPVYPWGRRGWRGRVQSATQWMALAPVVLGSDALILTVPARAARIRRLTRRPMSTVPVFCTLPIAEEAPAGGGGGGGIGVLAYAGDGARPDVVVGALRRLDRPGLRVMLLGGPGSASRDGAEWRRRAAGAGLGDRVEFTEVVPPGVLSARVTRCDLVVFANDLGPSSRRTTLAAALAHGRPVVALDGPERWQALVDDGAIALVSPHADELATVLGRLLDDPAARARLGARGKEFHDRHMTLDRVTDAIAAVLSSPRGDP